MVSNNSRIYRTLKLCWLLPLALGILIFALWAVFRSEVFLFLGVIDIVLGVLLGVYGILTAIVKVLDKNEEIKIFRILRYVLLMSLNVPIALLLIHLFILLETVYVVKILNNSNGKIEKCIIQGGGVREHIDFVDRGKTVTRYFWIEHDGMLAMTCEINNKQRTIEFNEYVTNDSGGRKVIEINPSSYKFLNER